MSLDIDNNLIQSALTGNREAFGQIYDRLAGPIFNFAFRMLRDHSAAEEVTQDAFVFLIEKPEKFNDQKGKLSSFLFGVARNKVLHRLRSGSVAFNYDFDSAGSARNGDGQGPLTDVLNKEMADKIVEGLKLLKPELREVLVLRELNGLSYQEIAEVTEETLEVVRVRIHRARRKLARELTQYVGISEV